MENETISKKVPWNRTEKILFWTVVIMVIGFIPAYVSLFSLKSEIEKTNIRVAHIEDLTAVNAQIEMINGTNVSMRGLRIICPNNTAATLIGDKNIMETRCEQREK